MPPTGLKIIHESKYIFIIHTLCLSVNRHLIYVFITLKENK